jgi:hypothetical protein
MGEFATTVQTHLMEVLSGECPSLDWETEYRIEGTPVDVAGAGENTLYLVELEWRRADPADNTAKLFRHLEDGSIDHSHVRVFQVFTRYYDLASGDYSSKRKNAEFVGRAAASVSERLSYDPVDLEFDPPKRGGDWPDDWEDATDQVVKSIVSRVQ